MAFEPVDVYPCTINEEYVDLSVTIASLFGHLCFGSTFAHDEEMERLASQREALITGTNDCDLQTPSSGERSVDQPETSPVSLLGSSSNLESRALDDLDRVPKRSRTSASFPRNHDFDIKKRSLSTEVLTPKKKLPRLKQSFKAYLGQSEREKTLLPPKSTDPLSNNVMSPTGTSQTAIFGRQVPSRAPHLATITRTDTLQSECTASHPAGVHPGTQVGPIEVSDDDPLSQGNGACDFLLEEIPEPDDMTTTLDESQLGSETQVTVSDTAFECQSQSSQDTKAVRLQQRREAYRAAKRPNGSWGNCHGLISSSHHHGEEEAEL